MQEIIELKIEETKSVVGGVMANVPAVTSVPRERPVTSSLNQPPTAAAPFAA
jgi:hypothetical protein